MQEYDIKRGHFKNIEGNKLEGIMADLFGKVSRDGDFLESTYGALAPLKIRVKSKACLEVEANMKTDVANDVAAETIKLYNDFLLTATGFTSKERKKRVNDKLKKGKL